MRDESSDVETLTHSVKTPFMGFDEQEFGANLQNNYSETTILIKYYDFYGDRWIQDDFCQNFPTPPSLVNGSIDQNICFEYDGVENTLPFTPITHPSCADTEIIITYEIDISSTTLQPEYLKLTIDPYNNVVRWNGLVGGSTQGIFVLTIKGTLPDGVTQASFSYNMVYSDCDDQAYTPSIGVNQIYYVTDPLSEYEVPDFGLTRPTCPVAYYNSALAMNTWLTGISDYSGDGKLVGWKTITESDMGIYTITILARDPVAAITHNLAQ